MGPTELLRDTPMLVRNARSIWAECVEERQFATMSCGYQRHGGLATGDEVIRLMRRRSDQPISTLARWIVNRNIVHFVWQGTTLLPLFQFDGDHTLLDPIVTSAVQELRDTFDNWEIAFWFVTPNASTNGVAPVDAYESNPSAVFDAARTDRFVVLGL